jgi:sucrose-6-phosphate hydrolase SacC (GH32 family)
LPAVDPIADGSWHVYASLRDSHGRSRIGRTLLVLTPFPRLLPLETTPVLDVGALGTFDDSGVTSSCIVRVEGRIRLFYTGWSRGLTVPFYLAIGMAESEDGRTFTRHSQAPILDRGPVDPFLTASPFVMQAAHRWRMWYVSGTGWVAHGAGPRHFYHVKYAESADGVQWQRDGTVCLDYSRPDEHAFGRPWVLQDADKYRMWFSSRGERYAIGFAESHDGLQWTRDDDRAGLQPARNGWDCEMVEYPCVFDWANQRYMLYNGNNYGRTGIGLAVWTPPQS